MLLVTGGFPYVAVVGNVASSVVLILINKWIVIFDEFKFMTILSGLHFYSSFLSCCILLFFGFVTYKPVNSYYSLLKITLGSLLSIIFMNLNLANNSVGFYQMSKLACIPVTLFIETILGVRKQDLNVKMTLSLLLIVLGMCLVSVQEVSVRVIGFIWAMLAVISTSLAQVLFGPLQKELGMNAMELLLHTSPVLTVGSILIIPLFENVKEVLHTEITLGLARDVLLSCIMAVLLNATNYAVLGWAAPLTYQVIGHVKTILIFVLGAVLFDQWPSQRGFIGIVLALIGVGIFTEENRRQSITRDLQLPNLSNKQ